MDRKRKEVNDGLVKEFDQIRKVDQQGVRTAYDSGNHKD